MGNGARQPFHHACCACLEAFDCPCRVVVVAEALELVRPQIISFVCGGACVELFSSVLYSFLDTIFQKKNF